MIYKKTFGKIEDFTPSKIKMQSLIPVEIDDDKFSNVSYAIGKRGAVLTISLKEQQEIYGFGLQMKNFSRTFGKVVTRNDADPKGTNGYAHASVPYFVTVSGKGYIIDTFRDVKFYIGNEKKQLRKDDRKNVELKLTFDEIYRPQESDMFNITVEIPIAEGVDVYYIDAENVQEAVKEYVMLSGGGAVPPLWGLGVYYRCHADFSDTEVLDMVDYFKDNDIPLSVIGLEPGWQTRSYSCSFTWTPSRFPNPKEFIKKLSDKGCKLNLWEHAYTNSAAPFYKEIYPYTADFEVWKGLVPDFTIKECSEPFIEHHRKLVEQGVTGFKLDECDGSDNTGGWFFPDLSQFPSGVDGEVMHNAYGVLYQQTILKALKEPTFSEVRSTHLFSAPYPFAMYSDLYDIKDFVMAGINSGFSGMLWSPELRDCKDKNDLINRMQILVFSAQYIINAFYLKQAPWIEFDAEKEAKEVLELRASLVPYLYSAYNVYGKTGLPPVRALVVDYFDDKETYKLSDEYLFGESIVVAPTFDASHNRRIYLPKGKWYNFYTGEEVPSGYSDFKGDKLPVFVKGDSIIPFATKESEGTFNIKVKVYGDKGKFTLYSEDGKTLELDYNNGKLNVLGDSKNYIIEK